MNSCEIFSVLLDVNFKSEYTMYKRCYEIGQLEVYKVMNNKVPSDGIVVRNARLAVSTELQRKRAMNQPIAKFDKKTGRVYLENSDGTIKEMGRAMEQGRYSERYR